MPYSAPLRHVQEWLRARVRRDSSLWRALFGIKQIGVRWYERRHARRWAAASELYGSILEKEAAQTADFFFVQVGAHDGSMDDPLASWIARYRWRGLFIEPQPAQFARLKAHYEETAERFIFENVAIDRFASTRPLYVVADDHQHSPEMSGLASLLPDRALATHAALGRMTQIVVPCLPLATLLERHQITRIDLLQIDTEGYDAVILETIDLQRLRPRLIHYEHRHLPRSEQNACARRLRAHGYEVHLKQHDAFAFLCSTQ